jgi:hypothetical protein
MFDAAFVQGAVDVKTPHPPLYSTSPAPQGAKTQCLVGVAVLRTNYPTINKMIS